VLEGLLLVVWSSIGLWVVGWVSLWVQSFGLGWRNWTHGQLCDQSVNQSINRTMIKKADIP